MLIIVSTEIESILFVNIVVAVSFKAHLALSVAAISIVLIEDVTSPFVVISIDINDCANGFADGIKLYIVLTIFYSYIEPESAILYFRFLMSF